MENQPPRTRDIHKPSFLQSPNSHSSSNPGTGAAHTNVFLHHPSPSPQPPTSPITRFEPDNPYPTTFVQADATSFKKVVQMLTGSSETTHLASRPDGAARNPIPPVKAVLKKNESASKLYERRNSLTSFKISPLGYGLANSRPEFLDGYLGSPRRNGTPEILSPSILDFPSLALSPVTPLIPDPFNRSPHAGVIAAVATYCSCSNIDMEAEDKAIKEKGFYLHQSPANNPRETEPRQLLPLFPITSPRIVSGSANATSISS